MAIHERVMCLHPDDIISRMANKKRKKNFKLQTVPPQIC